MNRPAPRYITPEKFARIVYLRDKKGFTFRQIAEAVDVGEKAAYKAYKRGRPPTRRPRIYTDAEKERVWRLRDEGLTSTAISKETGIPVKTVNTWTAGTRNGGSKLHPDEFQGFVLREATEILNEVEASGVAVFAVERLYFTCDPNGPDYPLFLKDAGCELLGVYTGANGRRFLKADIAERQELRDDGVTENCRGRGRGAHRLQPGRGGVRRRAGGDQRATAV